jgi:hypothetical protein
MNDGVANVYGETIIRKKSVCDAVASMWWVTVSWLVAIETTEKKI